MIEKERKEDKQLGGIVMVICNNSAQNGVNQRIKQRNQNDLTEQSVLLFRIRGFPPICSTI